MAVKESAYIRNELVQTGPVGAPLFCNDGYMSGEYVDGGFPVDDKPAEPEHVTVHVGPRYTVINDDMDSRFREAENHVPEHVIHLGNTVTYLPPTDPDYALSPDERRSEKAKAIAEAVRLAVERGEIDADLFDAD